MSLRQFIRDNTNDGTDIAGVLIDVMHGRFDGTRVGHRLTAAKLLTAYGHKDADDFIADNTPHSSDGNKRGAEKWVIEDPDLTRLIRFKTDDGRAMCLFLIEVMEGKARGAKVCHRVSAAKELLNRGFGVYRSRPIPKPPGSTAPKRSTNRTRRKRPHNSEAAAFEARVAERIAANRAAQSEPAPQPEPTPQPEPENQPEYEYGDVFNPKVYEFVSRCEDPNFDKDLAATNNNYWLNYTDCKIPGCIVHDYQPHRCDECDECDECDFDPNDHHY